MGESLNIVNNERRRTVERERKQIEEGEEEKEGERKCVLGERKEERSATDFKANGSRNDSHQRVSNESSRK